MREKLFDFIVILISLFVLLQLFIRKEIIYSSIIYALNLWVNNLIPSLFPFFIISDILINYNITNYIFDNFKQIIKKVFNISDGMLNIFILSMISGFPSNARNTRSLYDNGTININEANHILIFSHFANPIFIINTIGNFFFHNQKIGIIILISHYLSNFILGIIFRGSKEKYNNYYFIDSNKQFTKIFISSIKKAIDTTITICGIVSVFLVLSTIVVDIGNINGYNAMLVKGVFEITIGIEELSRLNISDCFKAIIASMILAFGGLSVHMQVISQIIDTKINYHYFLVGRVMQMILSGIITYLIYTITSI